jgi:c-di-GMP-binding flagellar brake protein YcgR
MAQTGSADEGYKQQFEVITSKSRIAAVLRPLLQKHSLVTATLGDSRKYYNTVLLEVDTEGQFLVLDELHPVEGHRLAATNKTLTLFTQLEGVNVNFTVKIIEIGSANNVAFYKMDFPESIRYRQRRSDYRVPVSSALSIPVEISSSNKESLTGELHDISAGGVCIRFPRKSSLPIDKTDEELQCAITLSDGKTIRSAFRICHIALQEPANTLLVGGCFRQLDKTQHRAIERYVVELQRKSRQKDTR